MHDVFHVSRFKKYYLDPQYVLATEKIELQEDLTFREEPVEVLDRKVKMLRIRTISLVNVLWEYHDMRKKKNYPKNRGVDAEAVSTTDQ